MPAHPLLQKLHENFSEAKAAAGAAKALSQVVFLEDMFRKSLILSAASLFESRIANALLTHVANASDQSECVVSVVRIKAVERQFHTYFDWNAPNANPFFKMLGDSWREQMKTEIRSSPLKEQLAAFLELGQLRNKLVHENFASFLCEKTSDEVFELYETAEGFVARVELLLNPPHGAAVEPAPETAPLPAVTPAAQ